MLTNQIEGKPEETLAVETLQIESDAAMIIRLAEELLTVSRTIKETWILGQLLLDDREMELIEEEMTAKVGGLVERVLQLEQRAAKVLAE